MNEAIEPLRTRMPSTSMLSGPSGKRSSGRTRDTSGWIQKENAFTTHVIITCMKAREKLLAGVEERLLALILRANRARIYEDLLRGADVRMDKALYPVLSATGAFGPARVSEIAE